MRIIVIGESCKDIFVYGNVKRLSPEAPVPVFNPIESISNLGMSGNVVQNLKSLDSDLNIIHWSQTENITKTRYVDRKSNHMFLRVDEGDNYTLGNSDIKNIKFIIAISKESPKKQPKNSLYCIAKLHGENILILLIINTDNKPIF